MVAFTCLGIAAAAYLFVTQILYYHARTAVYNIGTDICGDRPSMYVQIEKISKNGQGSDKKSKRL